ncbi:hypothetical protein Tco_1198767 [Tanacetum coccineum]
MASGGSDRDAKDALSKLFQLGTVAEYQDEFEIFINRVTRISQSLLSLFYISRLKLELQREMWRSRPTTLGEAFSLARIAEARFEESVKNQFEKLMNKVTDIPDSLLISFYISGLKLKLKYELLVSRPTTLGDAFSLVRIIEARFEAITEREQNIKEKADTTLSLPSKEASLVVIRPLDVSLRRPVDEVSSVIEDVFDIDESNVKGMQVRDMFAEFFEDKGCMEKVLSATKLPEGGNSHSAYSPYHLEDKVNFEGVGNVTPWAADVRRRKRVKCYVQGSRRRKRKKVIYHGSGRQFVMGLDNHHTYPLFRNVFMSY